MGKLPEYLVIGHVARDLTRDGSFGAGGTATYSALTADRLGLSVGVVTSADATFPMFPRTPTIAVSCREAKHTTTFENIYEGEARRQYLRNVADRLTESDLPAAWKRAEIVHLGPIAQEVDAALIDAFPTSLLGVTPQGWLRRWDDDGLVTIGEWDGAERILERADVVVLSLEDVGADKLRLDAYAHLARTLVVTAGAEGAIVHHEGRLHRVPAHDVRGVDPTGAGDVFATAYLVRFHETGDVLDAARYANCVASFVVEGVGATALPSRVQVEWRLRHGRLRA